LPCFSKCSTKSGIVRAKGRFEIVADARRYRAAKLAGQTEVPCEIRDYTDAEARDARLIENLQCVDLTPFEEAEPYQQASPPPSRKGSLPDLGK
jgi:ParB/RepB/Spo0J family partition protein